MKNKNTNFITDMRLYPRMEQMPTLSYGHRIITWLNNSTPGLYPLKMKTDTQANTYTLMFIATLFPIGKRKKQSKSPSTSE